MKIIVARYNEDIEWTKQFPNVIIYNKGERLNLNNEIMLENVGREGHTYYKYIYDNYNNLDDYTIFLQGNPFDHSPNIIQDLKYLTNNININPFLPIKFKFLSKHVLKCKLSGCKYKADLPLIQIHEQLFSNIDNKIFEFGAGAQFIVSKNNIHKRTKDFYLKIIKILEYSSDPIEGHVIERFHKLILN